MKVIGLCGGSGSGKGAVCSIFSELGIPSIDTDAVYHHITSYLSPCLIELRAEFGDSVVEDGRLDRAALRDIVFDPRYSSVRQPRLNEITHKYVILEVERILSEYECEGYRGAIIDAPLLIESGINARCDTVIAVIADRQVRIARIMLRDSIDLERATNRIASQMPDERLVTYADHVIRNNAGMDELRASVKEVYRLIFEK